MDFELIQRALPILLMGAGEINQNPCNNFVVIAGIFIFNFSYPKSCGHKAGFADVNELSDSFRLGIIFGQQIL